MSTTDENATEFYNATLKRGRVYFLGDREFLQHVPQVVNADDKAWLEVHAVDQVTVEGEGEHQGRPKFVFEVAREGDKPVPPPSPRARTR